MYSIPFRGFFRPAKRSCDKKRAAFDRCKLRCNRGTSSSRHQAQSPLWFQHCETFSNVGPPILRGSSRGSSSVASCRANSSANLLARESFGEFFSASRRSDCRAAGFVLFTARALRNPLPRPFSTRSVTFVSRGSSRAARNAIALFVAGEHKSNWLRMATPESTIPHHATSTLICCALRLRPILLGKGILRAPSARSCVGTRSPREERSGEIHPFVRHRLLAGWSIGRLTCSYYLRKLSFIHSHVPLAGDSCLRGSWGA